MNARPPLAVPVFLILTAFFEKIFLPFIYNRSSRLSCDVAFVSLRNKTFELSAAILMYPTLDSKLFVLRLFITSSSELLVLGFLFSVATWSVRIVEGDTIDNLSLYFAVDRLSDTICQLLLLFIALACI